MPEEPENMLEHDRVTAAGRGKEGGPEKLVGQQHGHGTRQHGHHGDEQIGGDQPGPDEQGHLHQRHAGRPHVHYGNDDVDGTHDGGHAHHVHGKDQERKRVNTGITAMSR